MWRKFNNNPVGRKTGDCVVRAISVALNISWDDAHYMLSELSRAMGEMPSADDVWGAVLRQHGFRRSAIPNTCPDCYTTKDFAQDHPHGVYVLGFGGHCTAVIDGVVWDAWDSRDEVPQFFWYRED